MELVVDFADEDQKRQLWKHLKQCKPLPYRVTFKLERDSVSKQQRGYYHAVVVETLRNYFGYEHLEMHDLLKSLHNSERKYIEQTGRWVIIVHSTESLDTAAFAEYLTKVLDWAAIEFGVRIPEPSKTIVQRV